MRSRVRVPPSELLVSEREAKRINDQHRVADKTTGLLLRATRFHPNKGK
jgi:hypothetical protein